MRVVVLVVLAAGCLEPSVVRCGDIICPDGTTCVPDAKGCFPPDRVTACTAMADGTSCSAKDVTGGLCRTGVCMPATCGDGYITGLEQCDGTVGATTCTDLGFYKPGGLGCTADCRFDVTGCSDYCGDGMIQGSELCDGGNLGGETCTDLGYYDTDGLACSAFCTFDVSHCTGFCGDGMVNGPEVCDHSQPPSNLSCFSMGLDWGNVGCSTICGVDTSACQIIDFRKEAFTGASSSLSVTAGQAGDALLIGAIGQIYRRTGTSWPSDAIPADVPANMVFSSIWGTASTNIYAVGSFGIVLHDDSTGWAHLDVGVTSNLWSVRGAAANDVWMVGDSGVALHYDGTAWTAAATGTTVSLRSLAVITSNDVFAGGASGTILHWDGTQWQAQASGQTSTINALYAVSPTNVYAISSNALIHYDGASWTPTGITGTMLSVFGGGANDVYAGTINSLVHFDGTRWTKLAAGAGNFSPRAAMLTSAGEIFIGAGGPGNIYVLHKSDGASWEASSGDQGFAVLDVALLSTTDAYAIGTLGTDYTRRYLYHFDGNLWTMMYSFVTGTDPTVQAVYARADNDVFVGLDDSAIRHWDGNSWTSQPIPMAQVTGFSSAPGTDLYASTNSDVLEYTGGTWVDTGGGLGLATDLQVFSSGQIIVVGNGVAYFDGTAWSTMGTGLINPELTQVWGLSVDDVWAVGANGLLLHFDGTAWNRVDLGVGEDLTGVGGTGPSDVYVTSAFGEMFHYDGTRWSPMRPRFDASKGAPSWAHIDAIPGAVLFGDVNGRADILLP